MEVFKTEYAVEINKESNNKFILQVAIFDTYEEAETFCEESKSMLKADECFNIIFIDYDEFDNEVDFGTVC